MSAELTCGDNCAPVSWEHLQLQAIYGAAGAGGLTAVGLLVNLVANRRVADLRRFCLRLEYGLASLTPGCAFSLAFAHVVQVLIWSLRASTHKVDSVYHAVEMICSIYSALDMLAGWAFVVTRGSDAVIGAALNGRFILDAFVVSSVVAVSARDGNGDRTWFSFSFLAAVRLLRVLAFVQRLDAFSSHSSWWRQVAYNVMILVTFVFASAASMMILEQLEDPSPSLDPPWDVVAGSVFAFSTMFTVGENAFNPRTVLGRAFAVCLMSWSLFNLCTRIFPFMLDLVLGKGIGNGSYRPQVVGNSDHVVVFGTPTGPMLWDFLQNIYHPNHFKDGMVHFDREAPDVVVLLPNERTFEHFQRYLGRQESILFQERVFPLIGDAFSEEDMKRVKMNKAWHAVVLPNLLAVDTAADDHANIMRVFAIDRAAPSVSTLCILHHADNVPANPGTGTFLSMDQFKLSLLAVACLCPGSLAFVSNLCKTVGYKAFNGRPWQKDYENGLGGEIYEVPLSPAYHGATFSEVYEDFLVRSNNYDVYLIGISEKKRNGKRAVRMHPGADTVIRVIDLYAHGIFVAPDRSALVQCAAGEDLLPLARACGTTTSKMSIRASTHGSKDSKEKPNLRASATGGDILPGAMLDLDEEMRREMEQERAVRHKQWEHELAERGYQQSMAWVQQRLLVQGFKIKVVSEVADKLQEGARMKKWDVGVGAVRAKSAPPAPISPTSPGEIQLAAVAAAMGVPPQEENEKSFAHIKNAKALELEKKAAALGKLQNLYERVTDEAFPLPLPPPLVLKTGGHLLLCIVSDSRSTSRGGTVTSRGPNAGIGHFLGPLRDKRLQAPNLKPSVIVLAEALPADWYSVSDAERVFFVRGSPLNLEDLDACAFRKASSIAIIRGRRASSRHSQEENTEVLDSQVVLATSLIEENLPNDSQTPVITDHAFFGSADFLPIRTTSVIETVKPEPVVNVGVLPDVSKMLRDVAGMVGMVPGGGVASLTSQSRCLDGGQVQEDYEGLEFSDYMHHPRYMRGQVFVASVITGLAACTVYNPSLVLMVRELLRAPMLLLPVPQEWERKSFVDFSTWLLTEKNLLAVAIYRSSTAADTGAYGRIDLSAPTHFYTYSAPPGKETLIIRSDRVICMLPSTH